MVPSRSHAQRRPARPSRQLVAEDVDALVPALRSTKAGSAEPATPLLTASAAVSAASAQRRPARPSRQLPQARSGTRTPPATLNEGRLGRAGNSHPHRRGRGHVQHRSTKAGSAEPATPVQRLVPPPVAVPRSTKAGSAEPATQRDVESGPHGDEDAQRRPARPSRQLSEHHSHRARPRRKFHSLNEGRLGRAGNSARSASRSPPAASAQRRPARPSRQLSVGEAVQLHDQHRSTKAGSAEPATRTSTRAGGAAGPEPLNEGRLGRAGNSGRSRR